MHVATTFPLLATPLSDRQRALLNTAADLYINSTGRRVGWRLPPEGLFPEAFGFPPNVGTLEYLRLLENQAAEPAGGGCCSGGCNLPKELLDAYPRLHRPADLRVSVVRSSVRQMLRDPQMCGSIPGDLADLVLPERTQTLSWDQLLRLCLRTTRSSQRGNFTPSYAKPHRRSFVGDDVILPGGTSETPEFGVVLDTSGSMSPELLSKALGVVVGVLEETGAETCWLYQADTCLQSAEEVSVSDLQTRVRMKGRGGTRFDHPLRQIVERQDPVGALLYLTDGYGDSVESCPLPLIWGVFTETTPPVCGQVVRIKA